MQIQPQPQTQPYNSMDIPQLLSEAWLKTEDPRQRDTVLKTMKSRGLGKDPLLWPSTQMAAREEMAGLYPNAADPQFAARLFSKQEFYESRAIAAAVADGTLDPCSSQEAEAVFELTPIQRVVARFLHPLTPYMGVLIDHGVGVGKTCTAVSIAEQFLEVSPGRKVIVLVPQALKDNFKLTVFDPSKMVWDVATKQWTARQCTGTSYLERLGLLDNPTKDTVVHKVEEDKRARYMVTGYQSFANWIKRTLSQQLPAAMEPVARQAAENEILRGLFSNHLIIIDEAHNLRDLRETDDVATAAADDAATGDAAENAGGKALNPLLKRIILNAEGLRLVLMTATPMYNSAPEICLLLSYLFMNDTKNEASQLKIDKYFSPDGKLLPEAQRDFETIARRYVTYMRGENPYTFPIRMRPVIATPAAASWPTISASTSRPVALTDQDRAIIDALPLVFTTPMTGSPPEVKLREATRHADQRVITEGASSTSAMLDARVQMGNISYDELLYGTAGWDSFFSPAPAYGSGHKLRVFAPNADVDSFFTGERLRWHAPKIHRIVQSVISAKGICFAYSQYIKAGALPLAVALERAGFKRRLADGSLVSLLKDVTPVAPRCAICGSAGEHAEGDHPFRQACYVLLTSDEEISPQFAGLIRQATTWEDDPDWGPLGSRVKVIIGSRVASEGLDLKCVREMHLLDAWYHLNRTEQIIGRAIRYCSHMGLRAVEKRHNLPPMSLNNCLIYLHALRIEDSPDLRGFETADMYAYRIAIGKAQAVGHIQRILKRNAWDCNLELEAIIFAGLPPRPQIDAQWNRRSTTLTDGTVVDGYPINDQDYTTYCDYQVCRHDCAISVARSVEDGLHLDASTFTVADARKIILAKQQIVRQLFADQVMVPESVIQDVFADLPWEISSEALMELLDGTRFRLTRPDGIEGFLIAKAGYIIFQPALVTDRDIPMTLRYAKGFQLRRKFIQPTHPVIAEELIRGEAPAAPVHYTEVIREVPTSKEDIKTKWARYITFIEEPSEATYDAIGSSDARFKLLIFLLNRYAGIPQARHIALRMMYDKLLTFTEQKILIEAAAANTGADESVAAGGAGDRYPLLAQLLAEDIYRGKGLIGYRIFNPTTVAVEYYCMGTGQESFTPCSSVIANQINQLLTNKQQDRGRELGSLVGFMAFKLATNSIVFKTKDRAVDPAVPFTGGAECGNSSNKAPHIARVNQLQHIGVTTDSRLERYMLNESAPSARGTPYMPTYVGNLTQQLLCFYMEWLVRFFDVIHLGGKRWFYDIISSSIVTQKTKAK